MTRHFKNLPIRIKLISIFVLVLLLVSAFIFTYFPLKQKQQVTQALQNEVKSTARMLAIGVSLALGEGDYDFVDQIFTLTKKDSNVVYIAVLDEEGNQLISFNPQGVQIPLKSQYANKNTFEQKGVLHTAVPLQIEENVEGNLITGFSLQDRDKEIARIRLIGFEIGIAIFLLGIAVSIYLSRLITDPIEKIVDTINQTERTGNYQFSIEKSSTDEVGTLIGAFNNMSVRIQTQTLELKQAEERYRNLFEEAPVMYLITRNQDSVPVIVDCNELFLVTLGYTHAEVLERPLADFYRSGPGARLLGDCSQQAPKGGSVSREIQLVAQDGRVVETLLHEVPEIDPDGYIVGTRATYVDITERKKAEAARVQAERELEAQKALSMRADRLRSLGEMAAGIAHELNQPLVGVRGLAEHTLIGMDRGWDLSDDKIRDRLTRIVEQADRMVHIIEHVRMFAREAGKPQLESVQINDVVKSGIDMIGTQFKSHGVTLDSELAEGLPLVSANPFSLEEVVLNLLNNARDAVEERFQDNLSAARVLLRTSMEENGKASHVVIEVMDNGVGIPQDIISKVFDPFFTTKDPDKGTGLGLSVSKTIVEQFGGAIRVQSPPECGTMVTISLPAEGRPIQEEQ